MVDRLSLQQWKEHVEGLVGPTPSGGRVHPYRLHLVAVFAAHSNSEGEATWCVLCERGDLTGYGYRMSEGQQVGANIEADSGV
jgi:hypothetical protein